MNDLLLETLRDAQRFGFFGDRPVEEAVEHARRFVDAIGALEPGARVVDLGSGGGLPGLVVADAYPDAEIVLVDRRAKRTDFLRRSVSRLRFDHVTVIEGDVADVARRIRSGNLSPFDVATARGFGPPDVTLRAGRSVIAADGRVVISEPPSGDRWTEELLAQLGVVRTAHPSVSVFSSG